MTDGAALSDVVRTLEIGAGKTLYLLPAGSRTTQAAALLESEAFSKLIGTAASNFDFVVVDTPPLSVVADAMAVAACVDSVVVVVRGGVTDRTALELTLQRLGRTGANLAGIVLNDVGLPAYYRTYSHHG
jgi:Mrp family chromosome partitioning ATPase